MSCDKCSDVHTAQREGKTTEECKCGCHKSNPLVSPTSPNYIPCYPYYPVDPCCPVYPSPIWTTQPYTTCFNFTPLCYNVNANARGNYNVL